MPPRGSGRDVLLERVMAYIRDQGLAPDVSLRDIADAVGTSHQLLTYHFKSKDKLLEEALIRLRFQDQHLIEDVARQWGRKDALLALWSYYQDERHATRNRAAFAVIGRAVHRVGEFGDFIASLLAWEDMYVSLAEREGIAPDDARVEGRYVVATVRGLLLDLLLTGRRELADAAFARLLADTFDRPQPMPAQQ